MVLYWLCVLRWNRDNDPEESLSPGSWREFPLQASTNLPYTSALFGALTTRIKYVLIRWSQRIFSFLLFLQKFTLFPLWLSTHVILLERVILVSRLNPAAECSDQDVPWSTSLSRQNLNKKNLNKTWTQPPQFPCVFEIKLYTPNALPGWGQMTWSNSFFQHNIEGEKNPKKT